MVDTYWILNVVIALFREDEQVLKKIQQAQEIYHPAIVIG